MRKRTSLSWLSLMTCAVAMSASNAVSAETWVAAAKPCPNKRLSPELFVVQQSDAELIGVTRCGRAVYRGQEHCMARVRSMSVNTNTKIPPVPRKANRLLISYSAAGGAPTEETLAKAGLKKLEDYQPGSFLVVEPVNTVTAASVNALMEDEAVVHAAPDYVMSVPRGEDVEIVQTEAAASSPSDPAYRDLWGLKNIGAPQAWSVIREAPKVVIAVIDTGVDYNHPDLKANMWNRSGKYGFDFYDDDDDPMDEQEHGTHCAGTIAGVGNNGVGVVGVSWKAQIMAMRFMGPDGSGSTSDAVKCIDWAVANGAHILSNSWAGPGSSQELVEAVSRAERKGVLFVAAAGNTASVGNNNDSSPYFPASLPQANVITVGAIDVNNVRASFSHYGPRSVDIGAPGVGIVSTVPNGEYAKLDGTSMAAPHVAGAAALIWAKAFSNPVQDPSQMVTVRDLIYSNARPVPELKNFWGHTSPARVPGGVLDISFLGKSSPGENPSPTQPTPTQPPTQNQIAAFTSARFGPGEITATESRTIARAKLSLKEASLVSIVANTSVYNTGTSTRLATGFSNKPETGQYWQESIRNPEFKSSGGWTTVGSNHTIRLPAGEHTIYWKVWLEPGASLKFHSGAMLIQTVPASSATNELATGTAPSVERRMRVTPDQLAREFR